MLHQMVFSFHSIKSLSSGEFSVWSGDKCYNRNGAENFYVAPNGFNASPDKMLMQTRFFFLTCNNSFYAKADFNDNAAVNFHISRSDFIFQSINDDAAKIFHSSSCAFHNSSNKMKMHPRTFMLHQMVWIFYAYR